MFNEQATRYDERAGLPPSVGQAVARSIVAIADVAPGEVVVELGAGTGEIGAHLARLPIRYVGLDSASEMLDVFRDKAVDGAPLLVVADCNQPWPLPDGSVAVAFASRVIHLLEPDHVVRETTRVCRAAGFLLLGRVLREPDSLKERLRRRRQQQLLAASIVPRQGEAGARRVIECCVRAGGEALGRRVVAEWAGETTPAAILAAWEPLTRMGSFPVDVVTRAGILSEIRTWARDELGDLDCPESFRERYAIDIVRLPERRSGGVW